MSLYTRENFISFAINSRLVEFHKDNHFFCLLRLHGQNIFVPLWLLLNMVRLVQLVEHQIVVLGVIGSSPISHPKAKGLPEREAFLF